MTVPDLAHTCRRCGAAYRLPGTPGSGRWVCPSCGAAPRPLLPRLAGNRQAATLALVALAALVPGVLLPLMAIHGPLGSESYSLVGTVGLLFEARQPGLAILIATFSLVFPVAKLGMILAATSGRLQLSPGGRRKLHRAAELAARYSMLDILVVAVMVVAIKVDGMLRVEPAIGTVLFCLAIVLSVLSGWAVRLSGSMEAPDGHP